jgi:hypothetical protein
MKLEYATDPEEWGFPVTRYTYCRCPDCFELIIIDDATRPDFCDNCRAAGCGRGVPEPGRLRLHSRRAGSGTAVELAPVQPEEVTP